MSKEMESKKIHERRKQQKQRKGRSKSKKMSMPKADQSYHVYTARGFRLSVVKRDRLCFFRATPIRLTPRYGDRIRRCKYHIVVGQCAVVFVCFIVLVLVLDFVRMHHGRDRYLRHTTAQTEPPGIIPHHYSKVQTAR